MHWVVLADESMKEEFLACGTDPAVRIDWISDAEQFKDFPDAGACFDLLYKNSEERNALLKNLAPVVIINAVTHTTQQAGFPCIRINAWPGFLKRGVAELATSYDEMKKTAEKIFSPMNRKVEWVPDIPGFITARIVAMIINEAYFTLQDDVSSKDEIDIAMKLGTNYPYGPFEWSRMIGIQNIAAVLNELSKSETRYQPSELLLKEASQS